MRKTRFSAISGCFILLLLQLGPYAAANDEVYIFYLHGRIIEDEGPRPVHAEFGLYDYPEIVSELASRGAKVVSEVRQKNTDIHEYAGRTIGEIEDLIATGVAPSKIVVVGFSKGGIIAIHISSFLRRPDVRYALLAACSDWIKTYPALRLSGQVLSVVETSDSLTGSCSAIAERGDGPVSFREIEISTGKNHGAFYLPRNEWMTPVLDWVHEI